MYILVSTRALKIPRGACSRPPPFPYPSDYKYCRIDGNTPHDTRQDLIENYNAKVRVERATSVLLCVSQEERSEALGPVACRCSFAEVRVRVHTLYADVRRKRG